MKSRHRLPVAPKRARPEDSSARVLKRLLGYSRAYWPAFLLAVVGNLIYAGMDVLFVNSLRPLTDEALVGENIEFMKMAPLFVLAVLAVRGLASFVSTYFMAWIGQKIVMTMRQQLVRSYINLPSQFFDGANLGDLISKVTFNTQQVARASTDALTKLFREGGTIMGILASLFYYNWQLTLVFLVSAPVIGVVVNLASRRFKRISQNIQDAMGGVTQTTSEIVNGYKVVKTFGGEGYENRRFGEAANNNRQQNMKLTLTQAVSVPLIQLIAASALAMVIYFAAIQLEQKTLTPGEFVTMMALMVMLLKPLKIISNLNSVLQQGIAAAQSVFEIVDMPGEIDKGKVAARNIKGVIKFSRVSFAYGEDMADVVSDIDLEIAPGSHIALVGKSGSGKSTLTSLLLRFYNPRAGNITLDGQNIDEFTLSSLRHQLGYVSQQVTLFDDTIENNIAYPGEQVDQARLFEAARKSHALEFIEKFPQGMQTRVGDNGARLSGGQRQRIAIARAFYEDAPVIILDEATSALDTESEWHIQAAFEALMKNRTTLVIAHRLSTIERADCIVVMKDGKILEQGKHQELLALNGEYAKLHQLQFEDA